jgi:alpha-ketoglutarate-dependent taurine dioxygenase
VKVIECPAAWRADALGSEQGLVVSLSAREQGAFEEALAAVREKSLPLTEMSRDDFPLPGCEGLIRGLIHEIRDGRGALILRGLEQYIAEEEDAAKVFWGLGQHLGIPEPQDADGALLHHIRDIGAEVRGTDNIRGFQTHHPLAYHNDGGDFFMLYCLRQSRAGGDSILVSAVSVYNEIVRRRPDLAEVLCEPFAFDARSNQLPGQKRVQEVPIFTVEDGCLYVLYKRGYIQLAQRFEEVPQLTRAQTEAMDLMDEVCGDPRFCLRFRLRPGDIEIANNFLVLHGRTGYERNEPRHLLRLWLTLREGFPIPEALSTTREFGLTWERRQRLNAAD